MTKAKVGDRIRTTERLLNEYYEGDEGEVTWIDYDGACVFFPDKDRSIYVFNEDFVVIENDVDTSFPDRKEEYRYNKDVSTSSAESIRGSILSVREKRNDLLMEITALDKEEAELVEKLKQQGFVLYEQNEPETLATEKKTVLYAEDIEADMTDPKNWKVGDILEQHKYSFKPTFTPITRIEDGEWGTRDSNGGESWGGYEEMKSIFKFHSRPL